MGRWRRNGRCVLCSELSLDGPCVGVKKKATQISIQELRNYSANQAPMPQQLARCCVNYLRVARPLYSPRLRAHSRLIPRGEAKRQAAFGSRLTSHACVSLLFSGCEDEVPAAQLHPR